MNRIKLNEKQFYKIITESVRKIIKEYDEHPYYERLMDYGTTEILDMFEERKNPWLPLINPSMYQKALSEFTKYGHFINFPTKYIYQWMGIIMKNTAILRTLTDICGHSTYFPDEDIIDFYFEDYDEFEEYKEENDYDDDYDALWDFLDDKGFNDWCKLPDGSDAYSDFGIEPLEKLISEYDPDSDPEKVIVIINKCLDVVHCRGDIASMFIQGGTKTLSQISD